jgi:hypothetical protein
VYLLNIQFFYQPGATSCPQRSLKFKIKKPWTACLGENKKSWKEQAARGKLAHFKALYYSLIASGSAKNSSLHY